VTIDYRFEPTLYWVRPEHLRAENLEGRMLRERRGVYNDLGDLELLVQVLTGGRNPENGEPYDGAEVATAFTYFADGNLETVT
ncbi:MAG: hypothetical protein GWN73_17315, partial [Actinobacteria bacterium]|nr:hypothetical protein [Actinomycetota bacterium]NIS32015.1 hypothetical protein [Actinomycetota bacterium]NIU67087.1 hypothetical protein [Actinomycetota bacterium]